MKTVTTLLLAAVITVTGGSFSANAQVIKGFYKTGYKSRNNGTFDHSSNVITLGYGVPNRSGTAFDYWVDEDRIGIGPAYLKYEHGVMDEVGIGIYGAAAASRYEYGGDRYVDRTIALSMGVVGYYHFNKIIPVRKLDVYAGAGLGFRHLAYRYDDDYSGARSDRDRFRVFPVAKVGARYYFTRSFGVYAEAGYDNMSDVNAGISFRF